MKRYYFDGVPIRNFSEPMDNKGFRDGKYFVKTFSNKETFAREKEMLDAASSCPGVVMVDKVGVVDVVAEDGSKTSYLAIREWYGGEKDIRLYCKKHYGEEEIIAVFLKLAENLFLLEETMGIIHNDLKPSNVLISDEGNPILIDFDISKKVSDPMSAIHTHATKKYSAPEKDAGNVSVKSDIFSFGRVLDACLWQNPEGPRAYSKDLLTIRDKCQEKLEMRYGSFGEVVDALKGIKKEENEGAPKFLAMMAIRQINIKKFISRYLPIITKILYAISLFFLLLGLYMIIRPIEKEADRPNTSNPNIKEDCSIVIRDIKNLFNKFSNE